MSMVWKKNNHNPSSKQDCREHNLNKYILLLNTGNCICPNYIASIYFSWQLLNNFKNRRVFIKVLFQINLSEVLCGMEVKINWYLFIIGWINIVVLERVICFRLYLERDFVGTMTKKIIAGELVKHLVVSE